MPKDEVRSEPYERDLEVPISAAVKQKKLERMAECLDLVDVEKAKMIEATSGHREIIKELQTEEKRLRKDVAKSTESRKVKVVQVKNFKANLVQVLRMDTRAVIEERAMTVEERQESMNYQPGTAGAKGAKKGLTAIPGGKGAKKAAASKDGPAPEAPPPEAPAEAPPPPPAE